jgi:hypothetical protein
MAGSTCSLLPTTRFHEESEMLQRVEIEPFGAGTRESILLDAALDRQNVHDDIQVLLDLTPLQLVLPDSFD